MITDDFCHLPAAAKLKAKTGLLLFDICLRDIIISDKLFNEG